MDATLIARPRSTIDAEGVHHAEMHQMDAGSGLMHTVTATVTNEADIEQVADLLNSKQQHVWANSGCRGTQARADREELP